MLVALSFQKVTVATCLLLLAWDSLIIGLITPAVLVDIPNIDFGRLLFLLIKK